MMKHSILTMLFMGLFLWSCNQEELLVEQEDSQEVYTVRLSLSGDIQTEESPLSRAETESCIYGIQVYKDDKYFASGIFYKLDDITINLLAEGTYRFVCTAICNSDDIVVSGGELPFRFKEQEREYRWQYKDYYYYYNSLPEGRFEYSSASSWALTNLNNSKVNTSGYGEKTCAQIDRFYGELNNYTPSVNGIVNLELKRVSFGIKVKVSNITDGDVSVKCYNDHNTFVDVSGLTSNYESEGALFSMANVYDAWQYSSSYLENITMVVTWNRGVGVTQSWTKTIQMKRNAMNTIRIKLGADDSDIGVGVTPEGGEMGGEDEEIPLG